jgi:hypothetical protein
MHGEPPSSGPPDFLLTGAGGRQRMSPGRRRAETALLRRPAAAEIACARIPGAVVLYARHRGAAAFAGTTGVPRRGAAVTGSVNAPGRRLEVGRRLPLIGPGGPGLGAPRGALLE